MEAPSFLPPRPSRLDAPSSTQERQADTLIEGSAQTLGARLRLVAKAQVKLWKALVFAMFMAGFASAFAWAIAADYSPASDAAGGEMPDLAAHSVRVERKNAKEYYLWAHISNTGSGPLTQDVAAEIHDPSNGKAYKAKKSFSRKKPLLPGQQALIRSEGIKLSAGRHFVTLIVDPKNKVKESHEDNNSVAPSPIALATAPQYDWQVALQPPGDVSGSQALNYSLTVTNRDTEARDTEARVDTFWDGILVGTPFYDTSAGLPQGASSSTGSHIPSTLATPGEHQLTLVLFVNGEDDQASNNVVTKKLKVGKQARQPDLTVVYVMRPALATLGQVVDFTVTYKNIGQAPVTSLAGAFNGGGIYVPEGDGTPDTSGPYPSEEDPLEPGESFSETYHGHYQSVGMHAFAASVDPEDEIAESDEGNNFYTATIDVRESGRINVQHDDASPASALLAGNSSGITVGAFQLLAEGEEIDVTGLTFMLDPVNGGGPDQIDRVSLMDGSTIVGQYVPTSTDAHAPVPVIFDTSLAPVRVSLNAHKTLLLKVDTAKIEGVQGRAQAGEGFRFSLDASGVRGKGVASGMMTDAQGSVMFGDFTIYRSLPTVIPSPVMSPVTGNGVYELFRFSVAADQNGSIGLYALTFGITAQGMSVNNFELWESGGASLNAPVATAAQLVPWHQPLMQDQITLLFDVDASGTAEGGEFREIPAGTQRTYTLRGTVSGVTPAQGGQVSTVLLGDSAFPDPVVGCAHDPSCDGINADAENDFIWSDLSSSTDVSIATTSVQWTNGFRVKSLPPEGTPAQSI